MSIHHHSRGLAFSWNFTRSFPQRAFDVLVFESRVLTLISFNWQRLKHQPNRFERAIKSIQCQTIILQCCDMLRWNVAIAWLGLYTIILSALLSDKCARLGSLSQSWRVYTPNVKLFRLFSTNKTVCRQFCYVITFLIKQIGHPPSSRPIDTITKNKYSKKRELTLEHDRYNVSDENNSSVGLACFGNRKTGSIKLIDVRVSGKFSLHFGAFTVAVCFSLLLFFNSIRVFRRIEITSNSRIQFALAVKRCI